MLEAGKKAPAFTLASHLGGEVSLADFIGKTVVVYFYPKDDTPGCTLEAQGFQAAAKDFAKRGVIVLGVSKDSIKAHCKFAEKYGLAFPLLSDPEAKMIEAYGAWGEKSMYGRVSMGIVRSTVIVGPDGKVARVFPKVKAAEHVAQVLAALDAPAGDTQAAAPTKKASPKKAAAKKVAPKKG